MFHNKNFRYIYFAQLCHHQGFHCVCDLLWNVYPRKVLSTMFHLPPSSTSINYMEEFCSPPTLSLSKLRIAFQLFCLRCKLLTLKSMQKRITEISWAHLLTAIAWMWLGSFTKWNILLIYFPLLEQRATQSFTSFCVLTETTELPNLDLNHDNLGYFLGSVPKTRTLRVCA